MKSLNNKGMSFPTIDLHGETKENLNDLINTFIEDNVKLSKNIIVIIHGVGSGILKNATHEILKKNKNVLRFYTSIDNPGITCVFLTNESIYMDKKVIDTYTETISEKNTIKSISIKNLFGMFNYNVDFNKKNIFVIHAPNGCGKTHFLNYIKMFLENKSDELNDKPFESLAIKTTNQNLIIEPFSPLYNYSHFNSNLFPKCNYISDLHLYNFEYNQIKNKNKDKIFQEIMNDFFCYEKIIEKTNDIEEGRFLEKFKIIYTNNPKFNNPSILKKGDILDFDDLSSGEKFIIKLFYKLIYDLKNNSFVIIDEPELSLHIEWQELLIKNIVKISKIFDVYILIATHSPYIVNNPEVEVGEVVYE